MSDQTTNDGAAGPELRVVVLLREAPAGIGNVIELLQPGMAEKLEGFPLGSLNVVVNGVDIAFDLTREPLVARELDYAVAQSLVRQLVAPAVAEHRAYLVLSAKAGDDVFTAADVLTNVAAMYADDHNGIAVWLPDADRATTDVLYAGEVSQRSAQAWFNTMAMKADETTALAHTVGVTHLGGADVQLRSTALDPAEAFDELRAAVATLLEARSFPTEGAVVSIGGRPHVLTPGVSLLRMGAVLDAVPTGESPAESAPKQKGWFRRG